MNILGKKPQPTGYPSPVEQAEKRRWNEYHGLLRDNAKAWRWMAFGLLAVTALAGWDDIRKSGEVKTIPFIVEVDKLGETMAAFRLEQSAPLDPRLIKAQLAEWVVDMRTVYVDQKAQTHLFVRAFAWIDAGSQASKTFVDWYNANADREAAKDDTVKVQIETVTPEGGSSWRVNWNEQKFNLKGEPDGPPTYHYAVFGTAISPPTTDAAILANPTGLFIETLQWGDRPDGRR